MSISTLFDFQITKLKIKNYKNGKHRIGSMHLFFINSLIGENEKYRKYFHEGPCLININQFLRYIILQSKGHRGRRLIQN